MKLESSFKEALFSVIRIRTMSDSGEISHGTGFVYEYVTEDNNFPFLVTAKQLVSSAAEGRLALMQADGKSPKLGKGYTLDIDQFARLWYSHPDDDIDVSITPFVPFVRHIENTGTPIHFNAFFDKDLVDDEYYQQADIGSSCYVIGFPAGYWDRKNLLPVARRSYLASLPQIDYAVRHQMLLDAPCSSGWLGSPVLDRNDEGVSLMGMVCQAKQQGEEEISNEDAGAMSVILKSDAVIETITAYLKEKGFM